MKVNVLSENKICVILEKDDIKEMNVSFSELDYNSAFAASLLWEILKKAGEKANISIKPQGEILIDIEPSEESCNMVFTICDAVSRTKKNVRRLPSAPMIFQFDCADSLLAARQALKGSAVCDVKSELYTSGGKYRLIVYHPFKIYSKMGTLLQFAKPVRGLVCVAMTKEHWRQIVACGAFNKILS